MPTDPTPPGELVTLAARLVRTVRRVDQLPAATRLLSLLDQLGPTTVTVLAQADQCAQPTMSAQVKELVATGLATRTPHPSDSRSQLVELTAAGALELARVRRVIGDLVARRLAATGRSPAEVATALAVLHDLADTPLDEPHHPHPHLQEADA